MRRQALCGLTALCLTLSGCGPLVSISSASSDIVTKAGNATAAEGAADRAADQVRAANADRQAGQTSAVEVQSGDVTTDVMTQAVTLFSDTNGQVTEWSVERQTAFETTATGLKARFETLRPRLTPELAADFEARFRRLDDRLKESAVAASVATLQAAQREGSELVSSLGNAELDIAATDAGATASGTPTPTLTPTPVEPVATPEASPSGAPVSVLPSASPSPGSTNN